MRGRDEGREPGVRRKMQALMGIFWSTRTAKPKVSKGICCGIEVEVIPAFRITQRIAELRNILRPRSPLGSDSDGVESRSGVASGETHSKRPESSVKVIHGAANSGHRAIISPPLPRRRRGQHSRKSNRLSLITRRFAGDLPSHQGTEIVSVLFPFSRRARKPHKIHVLFLAAATRHISCRDGT
jgi:hypothetical protein